MPVRFKSRAICEMAMLVAICAMGVAGCDRSATPVAVAEPDARVMLDRGLAFLDDGNNEKAIAAFTETIRLRPDDADAHYNRGLAHVRLDNFEAARADYTEAIKLRPDFSDAYTNRSVTFAHRGKFDEAIADCTKSIQLKPENALALRNRGLSYHEQGKYDLALADFNEALRIDAGLAEGYFNRANTYLKMQKTDLAAVDFAQAYRLDSSLDVPEEYRKRPATAPGQAPPPTDSTATLPQPMPLPAAPEALPAASETKSNEPNAIELATDLYKAEGFTIQKAPVSEEDEMICSKAEQSVHVKIKTVEKEGDPIHLAKAEVEQIAGQSIRTDLVIASAHSSETKEVNSNRPGRLRIVKRIPDWKPRTEQFKPVEFEYVPEK